MIVLKGSHRTVNKLVLEFTYGFNPTEDHIRLAKTTMRDTGIILIPGKWMVDVYPLRAFTTARIKDTVD